MGAEAIVHAGQLIGDPKTVASENAHAYAVVPNDARIDDLEEYADAPRRARATVAAHTTETLVSYFNRFKTGDSVILADQSKFVVVGIIDYHPKTGAAFREHRVSYEAPRSLEWKTWRTSSGRKMMQEEFAQFIEDNVVDIRTPVGADVLDVARNLQANKKVAFSSAIRLADGQQQFTYEEVIDGSSSKGTIKVPETFVLGIPVFFGGILYEVTARLRYRIDGGKLALWYELYRPEYIEQDAFAAILTAIGTDAEVDVWRGVP